MYIFFIQNLPTMNILDLILYRKLFLKFSPVPPPPECPTTHRLSPDIGLRPLYTQAKNRDHEIVRAEKKVSKGRS